MASPDSAPNSPDVVAKQGSTVSTEILSTLPRSPAPAAIIGVSSKGPAFVPFGLANSGDFGKVFGGVEKSVFPVLEGPIAANRYFENGGESVLFFRVLGAGNCKPRATTGNNLGRVVNAGFVVGQEIINTGTNLVGHNTYAGNDRGPLGRSYFLTTLMSESNGSTIFSDAGIQDTPAAHPILRGVLFAPSGVVLALSSNIEPNNVASTGGAYGEFGASKDGGANIGTVDLTDGCQSFVMLLNGHTSTAKYPSAVTASFDPLSTYQDALSSGLADTLPPDTNLQDSMYFANVFNRDPTKIQEAGHYLYTDYHIDTSFAQLTGSGVTDNTVDFQNREPIAMILTSSLGRNVGSATSPTDGQIGIPNFENFEDRFSSAFSPFVTSQEIEGTKYDLFRFHSFDAGVMGMNNKFTVYDIIPPTNDQATSFKIDYRVWNHPDTSTDSPTITFECNLDPNSNEFIAKVIGDMNKFYDFDAYPDGDKSAVSGKYPMTNLHVRVEMSRDFEDGKVPHNVVPAGFRGIYHLVTSGSSPNGGGSILTGSVASSATADITGIGPEITKKVIQPPLPLREKISVLQPLGEQQNQQLLTPSQKKLVPNAAFTWGVQYEKKPSPSQPNSDVEGGSFGDNPLPLFAYMPSFHTSYQNPWVGDNAGTPDVGGTVLDADRFNNNMFSLERIAVITGSSDILRPDELPDPDEWGAAVYVRNGRKPSTLRKSLPGSSSDKVRFVRPLLDLSDPDSRAFLKFTVPMMGGFDGLNIHDFENRMMSDVAVYREHLNDGIQGREKSTTAAYRKAISILSEKSEADMQILTIPGVRHRSVTDHAVESCEDKNDVLYVGDVEIYDELAQYVTASTQDPHVPQIIKKFDARGINSSYSAFYFPDIEIELPFLDDLTLPTRLSPSVAALGAIAQNDALAGTHAAPMGTARGTILGGIDTAVGLLIKDRDDLLANNINVIGGEPYALNGGIMIISQKTAYGAGTALDRVGTRRLMIEIRRSIRDIARTILFEPAGQKINNRFRKDVDDYMKGLLASGQIEDYFLNVEPANPPKPVEDAKNEILTNLDRFKAFGSLSLRTNDQEVESRTIRGAVFIRPVASDETIKLDINESME
tara:strand:+ start:3343 stop:6654 length:3312 start_codon:yes stop_codon:yes gene_type:complete